MPIETNCKVKFGVSNSLVNGVISVGGSSEESNLPFTNCLDEDMSKVWQTTGFFDTTGTQMEFDDGGGAQTLTLNVDYQNPEDLRAGLQGELNFLSSGWTVSYNTTTGKFSLSNPTPFTLIISDPNSDLYEILGWTGNTDIGPTTSSIADQRRNHQFERVSVDFGYRPQIGFFAMIPPRGENFGVSKNGSIQLLASNTAFASGSDLTVDATITERGAFFVFDQIDADYRHWFINITDPTNPEGSGIRIAHLYLGEYVQLGKNISTGFQDTIVDPSSLQEAQSGKLFIDKRTKYAATTNLSIPLSSISDKETLQDIFLRQGFDGHWYLILDPRLKLSSEVDMLNRFVRFDSNPEFTQEFFNIYESSFTVREAF